MHTSSTYVPSEYSLPEGAAPPIFGKDRQRGGLAIVGQSEEMQRLRMQVRRLGPHFRIVLLRGEVGTGKELVARSLHSLSSHAEGPFVQVCCALKSQAGRFDLREPLDSAHRGTLYLERIDAMHAGQQAELLEVLRGRQRVRSGPILVRGLEGRIIASTGEDLQTLSATGRFIPELYRRIASVEIRLAPLRDRPADIAELVRHFVNVHGTPSEYHPWGDGDSWDGPRGRGRGYHWPGNVAELRQFVERRLEGDMSRFDADSVTQPEEKPVTPARLQDVLEQHVRQVLQECGGNKVRAAETLGISRSTLYRMLEAGLHGDAVSGPSSAQG